MDWKLILLIEHIIIYWTYSYYLLYKNKIDNKYYVPDKTILFNILTNQIIGTLSFCFFDIKYIISPIQTINLYTIYIILLDMFILSIFQSIYFYILHRLFHLKIFYMNFHCIHHKNYITVPYSAINCHIIEHIFINIMSVLIGTKFWLCHQNSLIIWVWYATITSVYTHSNIIREKNPMRHDFHHLLKNVNYGSGYEFMDKFFGTYYKE
jgi:sterol desaturase/sphingolipid hydroxylase (fatty acid hydroxylase superfamily)